jgi:DGQHR domain-containing protein
LPALVGFAPASLLSRLSSADVLDERTGLGYQRRFSEPHSLDFRRYIQRNGSTTIPLTFNLRPSVTQAWKIESLVGEAVELVIQPDAGKVLSQVDCQHRLGHLGDLDIPLPFLIYINLNDRQEMTVFNTINSKAKGLSGSLMDYHDARLAKDLALERPELLIALRLNETESSPWYKQLDLGGNATSGLKRRASLRTMQKAVKRFLSSSEILQVHSPQEVAELVLSYWTAVSQVLREQWLEPRRHFLTKGIGVYALMGILGDLWKESVAQGLIADTSFFVGALHDFAVDFDWTASGPLRGLGGEGGALEALELLRRGRSSGSHRLIGLQHG